VPLRITSPSWASTVIRICIDFRAAAEGFLDLALDLAGRGARSHLYRIGDPLQAFYPPYSAFGRRPLIALLDIAFEGDPAITNEHFNLLCDKR
jgi:hypothetical protein